MALDRNRRVGQARLGIAAADFASAQSRAAYSPTFNLSLTQRSQTSPSTTQLSGGQTQVTNDTASYGTSLAQLLPWGGGRITVDFDANRSATTNVFSARNPSFGSGLSTVFTQPLFKGLMFDSTRAQIDRAAIERSVAEVDVRRETAALLNDVRHAYWTLVCAVDARQTAVGSETLAQRHLDDTRRRVELGTQAAIDVLEAEAEVALRHQATVDAEGALRTAQVGLKRLIGNREANAAYARGQVERRQADLALESLRLEVAADVTRAGEAIRSAEESMQAAAVARELALKRVDAEQARRDAGLSTTFVVLQAQRDLATAETNELRARLDYQTALADFERAQAAP
jgi:outer membrane protein TolC